MKNSEHLRRMARWFLKNGFVTKYDNENRGGKCGCFLHAAIATDTEGRATKAWEYLQPIVGSGFYSFELKNAGWTDGASTDAAAACLIAADIAECDERAK